MKPSFLDIYQLLFDRFGTQHWWPAESHLEMVLGAILTQNTAWANVERAIVNLKKEDALNLKKLSQSTHAQLAQWISPAGYFNRKATYIRFMVEQVETRFEGSFETLFELDEPALRAELLSWKGIGPETADSIMLYAAKRPAFVVDAYTKRLMVRHGWCTEKETYDEIAKRIVTNLPADVQLFNEFHALVVRLGKEHCKIKPQCKGCPLEVMLNHRVSV